MRPWPRRKVRRSPRLAAPQGAGDAGGELGGRAHRATWQGARSSGSVQGYVIGKAW